MEIMWKDVKDEYVGGLKEAYVGEWKVGSVCHNFVLESGGKSYLETDKFAARCHLPGVETTVHDKFEDEDLATARVESAIRYWFYRATGTAGM